MSRRLHEAFLQHGTYLRNWSPTTVRTYLQGLTTLALEQPTKRLSASSCHGSRKTGHSRLR